MPAPDTGSPQLASYLTRLERALTELPADERREILLETRSHVAERMRRDASRPLDAVLADLGDPEVYARQFVGHVEASGSNGALADVARVATGGWRTLPTLVAVVAAYSIAFLLVLLALAKLLEPNATGFFVTEARGHASYNFVISDPRHGGRDVLGYYLVVIAFGIATAIHFAVAGLLRRFSRKTSRRP